MQAKTLTDDTLDAIANHGGFGRLAGNGQTKARETQTIGSSKNRETGIRRSFRLCENAAKIRLVSQPGAPSKARVAHFKALGGPDPWRDGL